MGRDENLFEGKSLDEAVRKGLDALGLGRAEVIITVVDEGSGGFLGLGARPYRVRVVPRPGGAPRDLDSRDDAGRGRHSRGGRDRPARGGRDERPRGRERDRGPRVASADRGPRPERAGGRPERPAAGRSGRDRQGPRDRDRAGRGGERSDRPVEARPAPMANDLPPAQPVARNDEGAFEGGADAGRRRRRRGGRGRDAGPRESMRGPEPRREELRDDARPADSMRSERGEPRGEPMRGERDESLRGGRDSMRGERGDAMRGDRGDAMRGDRGDSMRSERGDSMRGDRGDSMRGDSGESVRRDVPAPRPYGEATPSGFGGVATASAEGGPSMPAAELEQQAVAVTTELLSAMGYDASVSATADGTRVEVRAVVPQGEEELTGRKGEVRQALQHLLNRMLNRGRVSEYHLQLEINDFWQRREEELRQLAQDLAEEALSGQREAVTEYLNAQERRIIHVALKEDARVKTYALGTGLIKRVAVAPADFPEQPRYEE